MAGENALDQLDPIFIVGVARSGTTLMASILDAHPNIAILPIETEIFSLWFSKAQKLDLHSDEDYQKFCSALNQDPKFRKLEMDYNQFYPHLDRTNSVKLLASFLSYTGSMDAANANKKRWGEKTPVHYLCLPRIFEAFPEARIVMMLRDPRAVLASVLKTPWNLEVPEIVAVSWNHYIYEVERARSNPRIQVVRYEQLVEQPKIVLGNLCEWLGEEFSEHMLDRSGLEHRLKNQSGWALDHRKKTLSPLDSAGVERWKKELDDYQIRMTEYLCSEWMRISGYEPIARRLSFAERTMLTARVLYHRRHVHFRRFRRRLSYARMLMLQSIKSAENH